MTAGLALLSSSNSASRNLHVRAGRYDAAGGESFPFLITARMNILGAGKGKTVIAGGGDYDHSSFGGSVAFPHKATIVVRSSQPVVIRDVSLEPAGTSDKGIMCVDGNAPQRDPPPDPFPDPNLVVDNVELTGFPRGLEVSNTRATGCSARLTRSTLLDNAHAITALGCGYVATWGGYVALELGTGPDDGNVIARSRDYTAIALWGCVEHLRVVGNEFRENNVGIHIDEYATYTSAELLPRLAHNVFRSHAEAGVLIHNLARVAVLEDNRFEQNVAPPPSARSATGVTIASGGSDGPKILRARRNAFVGNDTAFAFFGPDTVSESFVDFGRPDDPGNNVFRCNASPFSARTGFDVLLGINVANSVTLPFAGNYWDHVPVTRGVGAAANGTDFVLTAPRTFGVDLSGAQLSTELCPEGQPAGP
jgi:hypothetical protein